ncbi:MAG: POTRA domain-containing protein [Blastocatellia bacterium]
MAVSVLSCILSVVFCGCALAQGFENFTGRRIAALRVLVETDRQVEGGDELRALLRVREGAAYAMADIRRSLLSLHESGRVANARVDVKPNTDGSVAVTFIVTPQVRVDEVSFRGLPVVIDASELRARLPELERGARFSDDVAARGAEQIYEALRDRGYYQVSVEPQTRYDTTRTSAAITYNINAGTQATISEIVFSGAPAIAEPQLRTAMNARPGSLFSQQQLNADIQKLRELHLRQNYLDARIGPADLGYDSAGNKLRVAMPVVSGAQFTVSVAGFAYDEKKLRELLPLLREGGVNEAALEESARRLRENLQEQGFFFAEVTAPALPDLSGDKAELVFTVEPNERYRVTEIRIEGTNNLSYIDIADQLRSQPESFIPIPLLTRYTRGITSEQALRRDADTLLARLRDLGFRRARRVSINRAINPDNDQLRIIFKLEEGPRSHIGDIAFRGNTLLDTGTLRSLIDLSPGEPFSPSRVKTEGGRLLQHYFDRGYATATVSSRITEMNPDENGERVRVQFEITEGPLVFINNVFVSNTGLRRRTGKGNVEKYLQFQPGEALKMDQLSRSEQELYATGAFRSVRMRTEPVGEEGLTGEARRNIFVEVDEGRSRVLTYGGGFGSDEGPRGIFEVSDPNIFGRLTTASLRFRASPRNLLGQFSYTDQRPFGSSTPLLLSVLAQRDRRKSFTARRGTALLQAERRLSDNAVMLFRYSYETVRICEVRANESICPPTSNLILNRRDAPIRLSRLAASFAFDGRDSPFDSHRGRFTTVDLSFASRALGGNEQFLRFFSENQAYYTVPNSGGLVLAGDIRIGLARNYDRPAPGQPTNFLLPISERFFAGGSSTLRGYDFEEAGPRYAPVLTADQKLESRPVGGNALIIVNGELRRNVYRQLGLVGFYDTGNVFSRINDINFNRISHTAGLGIRIRTGLGPVRLDAGYLMSDPFLGSGLTPAQRAQLGQPKRWQFHISFGQAF